MRLNRIGQYEPYLVGDCLKCGKCLKVCPFFDDGKENKKAMINRGLFWGEKVKTHPIIGNYNSCLLANANSDEVNLAGASGGMVSSTLIYLLLKLT